MHVDGIDLHMTGTVLWVAGLVALAISMLGEARSDGETDGRERGLRRPLRRSRRRPGRGRGPRSTGSSTGAPLKSATLKPG